MEDETMKKVDWELKKRKAKEWATNKLGQVKKAYYDNEDTIRFWAPIAVPVLAVTFKNYKKGRAARIEERSKDLYHYDRRADEYFMSRRPLKSSELLELDQLYKKGLSKGEALKRMKLLK